MKEKSSSDGEESMATAPSYWILLGGPASRALEE